MRAQATKCDISKFPIHLTGVNPYWNPVGLSATKPRLAAYLEYKSTRDAIRHEHRDQSKPKRITHNKVFDRMRSRKPSSRLASTLNQPKRYSKVMLYSIIEMFLLVDSSQGAGVYEALKQERKRMRSKDNTDQEILDADLISNFLKKPNSPRPSKLYTREGLRDVISFYEYLNA